MSQKLRVGVIFGGRSGEHEVSLMSAASVLAVLDPDRYTVTPIGITRQGAWVVGPDVLPALRGLAAGDAAQSAHLQPAALLPDPSQGGLYHVSRTSSGQALELITDLDVIFPVLHGTYGEDGALQGLLEMADVAYVGAGVLGSSVGMDKGLFKDVMRANGIPVPASIVLLRSALENGVEPVMDQAERLGAYPLFVKPANLGSSVGVTKCRSRSDLLEGLLDAARYDRRILVEKGIDAREIEISVLGNHDLEASVPGEILPAGDFYTYESKYADERSQLLIPAPIPAETAEQVRELALRAYRAADCAGMARVDFLLDKGTGELYLSELNTIPGFTHISMYAKLWDASGLPYPALVDRLISLAMERKADRDRCERSYGRAQ